MLQFLRTLKHSDFVQKVSQTFGTRIFVAIALMGANVLIARTLGPDGQGLYAAAIALTTVGVQLGNFGLHTSNTFFVTQNRNNLGALLCNSLVVALFAGVIVSLVFFTFSEYFLQKLGVNSSIVQLILIWVPMGLALVYFQGLLVGLQNIKAYNLVEILQRLGQLLLLVLITILGLASVQSMYFGSLLALGLSALMAFIFLYRINNNKIGVFSFPLLRTTFKYGIHVYLAALFSFLVLKIDLLMVKAMCGATPAGFYSVAVTLGDALFILPTTVGVILLSKLSAENNWLVRRQLLLKVLGILTVLMLGLVGVAAFAAAPMVHLLFGDIYLPSVDSFIWLLPGIFLLSLSTSMQNYLAALRRPWTMFVGPLAAFLLNLPLNLALIPKYQGVGAAMASSLSYGFWFIIGSLFVWRLRGG